METGRPGDYHRNRELTGIEECKWDLNNFFSHCIFLTACLCLHDSARFMTFKLLFIHLACFKKDLSTMPQFVMGLTSLYLNTSLWNEPPYIFYLWHTFQEMPLHFLWKGECIFHRLFVNKKAVFIDLWNTVSRAFYFYVCSRQSEMERGH